MNLTSVKSSPKWNLFAPTAVTVGFTGKYDENDTNQVILDFKSNILIGNMREIGSAGGRNE